MIRKGFVMRVHPGCEDEYARRHAALWPEMKDMIARFGGHNYSIFLDHSTGTLYGYIELDDEQRWTASAQDPVCRKWWEFMAPLMDVHEDLSPVARDLEPVFHLD